ncbi:RENR-like protein [Mya arenaria]|uniref:RENR-like protein n=1 Tax=Mya arenaria TaxID=6604 RepID=A0ABY7G1E7_MYAAR|nr:RENR-like protein [Mya arenaria]
MDDRLPAKMIIFVLSISLLSLASGQKMIVAHAPQYVTFQEQGKPLPTSDVSKMISHTLGMPTKSDMTWHGMQHGSVFKRPKANVLVTVLTVEGQPGPMVTSKAEFPVELIFDVRSGFDVFKRIPNTLRRMSDRLMDGDSVAQQHTVGTLNSSINTDLSLMGELQMTEQFITLYKDNVVVEILLVTPPTGYVRKVRALQQATTPKPAVPIIRNETNSKVAPDYDENYPVMFNIVLWLMIFLAVSMLAVSYGIWNIDPGRDSIIYRMTTTRLKKD